ncbi:MAG: aspartate-semialdehyde dehydrogenase [Acidimicrobiia bacterium]
MAKTAVVGATGAVGRAILSILAERDFPVSELRLMASSHSAGRVVTTPWGDVEIEDLSTADPSRIDVALFSAGGSRSKQFAPAFAAAGAVVVDNSSAFRMDPSVPLVVVGVNDEAIHDHHGIVANPNCTTMGLMMAIAPLHRAAGLESMVVSSYQAVSGSGQHGVVELARQITELAEDIDALANGGWKEPMSEVYARPIGFNALPFAGNLADGGYTDEEWKLVNESRKILDLPELRVEPTCVRVPVVVGHGIAATLYFSRPLGADEASNLIADAPGVELWTDKVPTALDVAGKDDTLVGRLRETVGTPGGLNLWCVSDNLRKGAALNTVQIAELLDLR